MLSVRAVQNYSLNAKNVDKMAHAKSIKNARMVYTDHY